MGRRNHSDAGVSLMAARRRCRPSHLSGRVCLAVSQRVLPTHSASRPDVVSFSSCSLLPPPVALHSASPAPPHQVASLLYHRQKPCRRPGFLHHPSTPPRTAPPEACSRARVWAARSGHSPISPQGTPDTRTTGFLHGLRRRPCGNRAWRNSCRGVARTSAPCYLTISW